MNTQVKGTDKQYNNRRQNKMDISTLDVQQLYDKIAGEYNQLTE